MAKQDAEDKKDGGSDEVQELADAMRNEHARQHGLPIKMKGKAKSKPKEGSAAEEATESKAFEKKEDAGKK